VLNKENVHLVYTQSNPSQPLHSTSQFSLPLAVRVSTSDLCRPMPSRCGAVICSVRNPRPWLGQRRPIAGQCGTTSAADPGPASRTDDHLRLGLFHQRRSDTAMHCCCSPCEMITQCLYTSPAITDDLSSDALVFYWRVSPIAVSGPPRPLPPSKSLNPLVHNRTTSPAFEVLAVGFQDPPAVAVQSRSDLFLALPPDPIGQVPTSSYLPRHVPFPSLDVCLPFSSNKMPCIPLGLVRLLHLRSPTSPQFPFPVLVVTSCESGHNPKV
jgi:hypothetical protein